MLGAVLRAPGKDPAGRAAERERRENSMIWSESEMGTPREARQGAWGTCQGREWFRRGLLGF